MYHPVSEQCDDTPNILADRTIIEPEVAGDYRYIAMSRDLLEPYGKGGKFNYGDRVLVLGAGEQSGFWIVKDTMNRRWKNRIDFLQSPGTPIFAYDVVFVTKVGRVNA